MNNNDWLADIKVLSFDLDDTLWDCAPVIEKAELALREWMSEHTPKVINEWDADSIANRRANIVRTHPEIACDMTLLRHKMIEGALTDAGYPSQFTDDAFEVFYQARSEVSLYDNVHTVLESLGKQYALAVITNGNADLSLIGLADKFSHIQRASINNAPKPEAQMFNACLQEFGIAAHQLAHIGDNVVTDVGGAQSIGARTVWFQQPNALWPEEQTKPDASVASLKELQSLFLMGA